MDFRIGMSLEDLNKLKLHYFLGGHIIDEVDEEVEFLKYLKEARRDFCNAILRNIPVKGNLEVRTEIDSFLIAFDQAYERLENKL